MTQSKSQMRRIAAMKGETAECDHIGPKILYHRLKTRPATAKTLAIGHILSDSRSVCGIARPATGWVVIGTGIEYPCRNCISVLERGNP